MEAADNSITRIPADDEKVIRTLLKRLQASWARGDGNAYAACFSENSDYITYNGIHLHGRTANADLHSALFRGVLKGTTLSADIAGIELLSDHVALVRTTGSGRKKSHQTFVLVKHANDWLIRSFQNTRIQPISAWITRWLQKRASRTT